MAQDPCSTCGPPCRLLINILSRLVLLSETRHTLEPPPILVNDPLPELNRNIEETSPDATEPETIESLIAGISNDIVSLITTDSVGEFDYERVRKVSSETSSVLQSLLKIQSNQSRISSEAREQIREDIGALIAEVFLGT